MTKPIIYCDMDGVLADFKTGAQKNYRYVNQQVDEYTII